MLTSVIPEKTNRAINPLELPLQFPRIPFKLNFQQTSAVIVNKLTQGCQDILNIFNFFL